LRGYQLKITYDIIQNLNYPFYMPVLYTFRANTNFIQVDEERQSNKSATVTWLDIRKDISVKVNN
jgi:hypothetical protein